MRCILLKRFYNYTVDNKDYKIVVADILPPVRKGAPEASAVHLAATPVRRRKAVAAKRKAALVDGPELKLDGPSPKLDAWFKKGREEMPVSPPLRTRPSSHSSNKFVPFLILFLVLLLAGGYGVARAFSKLYVTIELRTETVSVDKELSISTKANVSDVQGEVITYSHVEEGDIPASGSQIVNKKASATVIIFNKYSSEPQTLIATTRFQAHDGKIYRIAEAVSIPGLTIKEGKQVAGSVETVVYADQPGPEYNQGLTDFTIPGFKGTDKYAGIYARSKTKMEGGFVGKAKVVTQDDIDTVQRNLDQGLKEKAGVELRNRVPGGFVLLDGAYEVTTDKRVFSHIVGDPAENLNAKFTVTARGIVVRTDDLARKLVEVHELPIENAQIANLQDLRIEVVRRNIQSGTMIIHITGNAMFTWDIDEAGLKESIVQTGDPDQFAQIFQRYPVIQRAEARFTPSWIRTTPTTVEDIVVEYSKPL